MENKVCYCPQCGTANSTEAMFCRMCGTPLKQRPDRTVIPETVQQAADKPKKKKRKGLIIGVVTLAVCFVIGVAGAVAFHIFREDKSGDYVAYVKNTGQLCTLDVTKKEKIPVTYSAKNVRDIKWADWWMNWGDLRRAGLPEAIDKLLKYSSTTQISDDGNYLCYASNYEGMRSYRLAAQQIGKSKKEAVMLSDDVVMHRVISGNKIIWLKSSNNTLYISDLKGKKKVKIAENVAYAPFFVDIEEKNILWYNDGDMKPCIRNLGLKDEVRKLNWDTLDYISADMKTIIGTEAGDLKVVDRFGQDRILKRNTAFSSIGIVENSVWFGADYGNGEFPFVRIIGEESELYCQLWDKQTERDDIYHYKDGKLVLFREDCSIISAKGNAVIYVDNRKSGDSADEEATYLWAEGKTTKLQESGLGPIYFSKDCTKGWAVKEAGNQLFEFDVADADGTLTDLGGFTSLLAIGGSELYYTRPDEMDVNVQIYCNDQLVDEEGSLGFLGKDKMFYYRVGQDIVFTLKRYNGEETSVAANEVIEATVLENGNAAVVTCQNYEMENGDLMLYTPEGEQVYVDDGVIALADTDITVRAPETYR